MYKCSICGKEYETVTERARCELECDRNQRKAEEAERKLKLVKEKEDRNNQIIETYNSLQKMIDTYRKDYGETPMFVYRSLNNVDPIMKLLGFGF